MSRVKDEGFIENFFRRNGRLNRWRYFKRTALLVVIEVMILTFLAAFFEFTSLDSKISSGEDIFIKFIGLIFIIPQFCLMARRLQDLNKNENLAYLYVAFQIWSVATLDFSDYSEPTLLENLVGIIQILLLLYTLLFVGTRGKNKYGEDPLA